MRSQMDSYSMLICSKYVQSIEDIINIALVNSKFKENNDKFHFNPFQINTKTRKYFINLQTFWLFHQNDEIFSDGDISGYYVYYDVSYHNYLKMKDNYQNIKFRRIIYTKYDRLDYGNEIPNVVNKLNDGIFYNLEIKKNSHSRLSS